VPRSPLVDERYLDALASAYEGVAQAVQGREERDFLRPTRCTGWAVGDLLFHMLLDAERALRTFASPAEAPPDVDYATYWEPWSAADDQALDHARFVRLSASAHRSLSTIGTRWNDASSAALRAARAGDPAGRVSTQGHVLAVPDFVATLVVEAAVHHLDLVLDLPQAKGPGELPLRFVRETVEAMLGETVEPGWDDATLALKATGRADLSGPERQSLGSVANRFPVFS
jgi:hypothetical protein